MSFQHKLEINSNVHWNQKINFYLTCLLSFLVPIHPKVLPIVIILLSINWIIFPANYKTSIRVLKDNLILSSTVILYLLYLLGMAYSTNFHFGGKVLETKLSLLLLPLIYSAYVPLTKEKLVFYLKYFVFGVVTYAVLCFSYATYAYFLPLEIDLGNGFSFNYGANYFYYSYLSLFFHPSYAAMYVVFALSLIVVGLKKDTIKFNFLVVILILVLSVFILLLSSKAGWICLALLSLYSFSLLIREKKAKLIVAIAIPLASVFYFFNVYYTPIVSQRIPKVETIKNAVTQKDQNNKTVTTSNDGNASRVFIWRASAEVFYENFLFGTGTGDSKDVLLKKYLEKEMNNEYQNQLNSHNQFLNTAVSLGIIGLIVLIFSFYIPFYQSVQQKDTVTTIFVLLIVINLLFESMYETQAGIVFYAFFNTILCSTFVKNK